MDIVQLERELTRWAAGVLGLTVDAGLYRGGLPPTVRSGVTVMVTGKIESAAVRIPEYNVQILGKFDGDDARDRALAMLAALSAAVPCYGLEWETFRAAALLPRGGGGPYLAIDNGQIRIGASCNLAVSALTKA